MLVNRESWQYGKGESVQISRYRNSHNLLHWHYDCELLYAECGGLEIFCDKKTYTLTAGQTFFIDSGLPHYMRAVVPETIVSVLIFKYDAVKPIVGDSALVCPLIARDYGVPAIYARLKEELARKKPFYAQKTVHEVAGLLLEIFRGEPVAPKARSERASEGFKKLLADVDEKYRFYTLETGAAFMQMNCAYFSRFFHKMSGMTFSRYLNCVRVEKAICLLTSDERPPVAAVADRCGFNTIRNFNRNFKSYTGYSPSALPQDFRFDKMFYRNNDGINPTLLDCELIESSR